LWADYWGWISLILCRGTEQKLWGFIFGVLGLYIMPFYKSLFQQRGTNLRLAPINFLVCRSAASLTQSQL